jgi:ketosteroid isomerase-like protein
MSQENGQVVRKPLRVGERSSRPFDQRLFLRFPRLVEAYARLIARLPPGSRFRQAALWRAARNGIEAFNRRDFEAVMISHHREREFQPPRELVEAGIADPSYRGPAGYMAFMGNWFSAWGALRVEPQELIDLGDRLVMLGRITWGGGESGVPVDQCFAGVYDLKEGMITRERQYFDHAEALAAVGLSE